MKLDKVFILNELMKLRNFNTKTEFAEYLGISTQNLSKWFSRNSFNIDIIVNKYPEVNRFWLLTGEGEMLNEQKNILNECTPSIAGQLIPLLPISAQGGRLNDFVISVRSSDCERIISPIAGADFAISIAGDSMAPEYPSGSQVLVKKINESAFIEWGKVYVLDTCNGTVIKKLMPSEREDTVLCVSLNEKYPPFQVAKCDITSIFRVMLAMAIK